MKYHITVSIEPELLEQLDRLSKEKKVPRNKIIEELIKTTIKKKGGKSDK